MMQQMNLFDFLASTQEQEPFDLSRYMNAPLPEIMLSQPEIVPAISGEPPCYTCIFAVKRGSFRLCGSSGKGYKHIGIWEPCAMHRGKDEN